MFVAQKFILFIKIKEKQAKCVKKRYNKKEEENMRIDEKHRRDVLTGNIWKVVVFITAPLFLYQFRSNEEQFRRKEKRQKEKRNPHKEKRSRYEKGNAV